MCNQRSRDFKRRCAVCSGVRHQSIARAVREQTDPMLSNGSRDTLMSYADHSMQRKSNAPSDLTRGLGFRCLAYYSINMPN